MIRGKARSFVSCLQTNIRGCAMRYKCCAFRGQFVAFRPAAPRVLSHARSSALPSRRLCPAARQCTGACAGRDASHRHLHPRGSRRHCPQAHGEPAGRSDQHRRLHEQRYAKSRDLAIRRLRDHYVRPSTFVSAGPGTQTFVMRGVSDGSNPNYAKRCRDRVLGRRHVDELLRHARPICICTISSASRC